MGANQSSNAKSLGAPPGPFGDSVAEAAGGGQQPTSAVRHKLSASLRKSVNNVLTSAGATNKSSSKIAGSKSKKAQRRADAATSGSPRADTYYVSHNRAANNNFAPASSMNNYVTMQQQQPAQPMTTIVSAAAGQISAASGAVAAPAAQLDQQERNNTQNGVYGTTAAAAFRGSSKSSSSAANDSLASAASRMSNLYTTTTNAESQARPLDFGPSAASGAAEAMNRDGSFSGRNILAQDTQQLAGTNQANIGAPSASRSQQQRHPTTTSSSSSSSASPYQLSRAVNTKTSSVLHNTTGTNGPAVAMPKLSYTRLHQQQQQQQQQHGITDGQPGSLMGANCGNGISSSINGPTVAGGGQKKANNKSPPSQYQPAATYQISGSANKQQSPYQQHQQSKVPNSLAHQPLYYQDDDVENHQSSKQQFYARNILDMDHQLNGFHHQQIRYKCPQQQYQYLNPNHSAIDFHQATYTHNSNNNNSISFHHRNSPFALKQQQPQQQLHLDCLAATPASAYNSRSYSFGSSTLEAASRSHQQGGKRSQNLLVSIFQGSNNSKHHHHNHHSNTISLAKHRNNKSSANINSINQRSFSGSLKRIKSAPLTTYEAMRTIDMYLIRQIARSCMDFEMEQKIDLEIRLRELAAQSMLEARTEIDVLEVEKSLLTSDQRMNCYASQLEQQRKQLSNPSLSTDSGRGSKSGHRPRSDVVDAGSGSGDASSPSFSSLSNSQSPSKLSPVSGQSENSPSFTSSGHSRSKSGGGGGGNYGNRRSSSSNTLKRARNKKREQLVQSITSISNINCNMTVNNRASVSVSEIRIPLMWRDVDHFKGRGDYKRFAVFCLLKIDSQIYDTQLISDVDREVTDVTFDDMVVFNEIDHTFELTLEVYSCVYLEQFSLSSTPRKLKEKLTSSVSRAMGRRLATQTASVNYTKELQAYDKSYRFAMIASATLRLEDASDSVKTYDLVLVSPSAHHRNHPTMYRTTAASTNYAYSHHNTSTASSMTLSNTKEMNKNTLPLFGHFCCKLFVRPDVFDKGIKTGYLKVAIISAPITNVHESDHHHHHNSGSSGSGREGDSPQINASNSYGDGYESSKLRTALAASSKMATLSMSSSTLHWGLLRNFALHLWPVDEQQFDYASVVRGELPPLENPRKPPITLNIDKYTRLLRVSNSSLTLETGDCCFVLGTYCPDAGLINQSDEISHWLRAIEQQIYDSHIWGSVLNHYPPHTKQPANSSDGGRMMANQQTTRNHQNGRATTLYS